MQEEIRRLARQLPFVPFSLHLNDGREFRVSHPDYLHVARALFLVVEHDDCSSDYVQTQNITRVSVAAPIENANLVSNGNRP